MEETEFIDYLKTLKPEDWRKMATSKWTVKDVVAHMVGWERSDVDTITQIWETQSPPPWKQSGWGAAQDDEFNAKWVAYYSSYTPEQLLAEWEYWRSEVGKLVQRIGEENMRAHMEWFDWLFEGVADNRADNTESHYKHHYNQIKRALEA